MQRLSLRDLINQAKETFLRFPFSIFSSLILACVGIYLARFGDTTIQYIPYINILFTASLGIPLYFVVSVFFIKNHYNNTIKAISLVGITALLVILYFSFPTAHTTHQSALPFVQFIIFFITAHLFVFFLPYINEKNTLDFWFYNQLLFIRFTTSLVYSFFVYIGLAIPIAILRALFDVPFDKGLYEDIFIVVVSLFNTWFFLAGIPKKLDSPKTLQKPPHGLKVFIQFVALPLLILYIILLYAYGLKIVVQWDWPRGLVSYLIIFVSTLGTLTFLLAHPYSNPTGNRWIYRFTKNFYYILLPLLVLLCIALSIRIESYGITLNRYILILLGGWVSIVALCFFLKKPSIKFIPISLAMLLIATSFGPWSLFSVSERSQLNRLKFLLENSAILVHGKIQHEVIWDTWNKEDLHFSGFMSDKQNINDHLLTDSLHNEVYSILNYLDDSHGFNQLHSWIGQPLDSMIQVAIDSNAYVHEAALYMRTFGLSYEYKMLANDSIYTFKSKRTTWNNDRAIDVRGYDYFIPIYLSEYSKKMSFSVDSIFYTLKSFNKGTKLLLTATNDSIQFNLKPLLEVVTTRNEFSRIESSQEYFIRLDVLDADITIKPMNKKKIDYLNGRLFFQKKK